MMQKINKSGHINWTRAIMIFSQLLLTAFVAQWIYSQYNDEKETLKKELSNLFYISQQEAIDTIILNIFDPLMGNDTDSSFYHIQLDFGDVITSYSIHYTKLYESKLQHNSVSCCFMAFAQKVRVKTCRGFYIPICYRFRI